MADSIPATEVLKNLGPAPEAQKPISAADVLKNIEKHGTPDEKKKDENELDPIHQAHYENTNKMIGSSQYTSPYYQDYDEKHHLGEAFMDDADRVHYKDKDDNWKDVDADKHVVIHDPKTGKLHAFERSEDTDKSKLYSILTGFGSLVQQGFASTSPVTGGVTLSAAQKALQAQRAIKDGTDVTVPVSRASVQPGLIARLTSHIPGVNTVYEKAAGQTAEGLGQASSAAAETQGASKTAGEAGEAAAGGLKTYLAPKGEGGVLANKVGAAYDAVDAHVDQVAKMPLSNTLKVAQDLNLERQAAERPDEFGNVVKEVMGAVTNPDGLNYNALKNLRSVIGEKLGSVASDMEKSDLKRIYKALSDDMRSLVEAHGGPRGLQLWERANTMAAAAEQRRTMLQKILGVTGAKSDEAIFAKLKALASTGTTADIKTLAAARKSMSAEEWQEVVAGTVYRLGRSGEGAQEVFNPEQFLSDFAKISEAGKNLMFGESSQLRRSLEAIYKLSSDWPKMATLGHEPGDVSHATLLAGAVAESHETGGGPLKLIAGVFGARTIAKFLSRPATAANVAKFMQSYKIMALKPTKANLVILNNTADQLDRDAAEGDREAIGQGMSKASEAVHGLVDRLPWNNHTSSFPGSK